MFVRNVADLLYPIGYSRRCNNGVILHRKQSGSLRQKWVLACVLAVFSVEFQTGHSNLACAGIALRGAYYKYGLFLSALCVRDDYENHLDFSACFAGCCNVMGKLLISVFGKI